MEQVDERQLAQLFQAAADDGPPAGFGHSDVVAASHRETRRRRTRIAGGSALVFAVLLGGAAVGNSLLGGPGGADTTTAGGLADSAPHSAAPEAAGQPPAQQDASELSVPGDQQRGTTAESGKAIPWPGLADSDPRAECGPPDQELADALAAQFPAAAQSLPAAVPDACPPEARAVAMPVSEDGAGGWIYLVLAPVRGDGPADQPVERAGDGALGFQRLTPSGRVLVVLSVPAVDGGQPPFAADTMILAEEIGSKF